MTEQTDTAALTVTVRYYAAASAATGLDAETVRLDRGELVADLAEVLAGRHGAELARVLASSSFLIDGVAGGTDRVISTGATVDVLPPFAGG